jgi:hypothetical protein
MPHSARLPGQSGWWAVMAAGGSACARCHHSPGLALVAGAQCSLRRLGPVSRRRAPVPAGVMLSATGRQGKGTRQGDAASKGPAVPGTQEQ